VLKVYSKTRSINPVYRSNRNFSEINTTHINAAMWADRRFVECKTRGKYSGQWAVEG